MSFTLLDNLTDNEKKKLLESISGLPATPAPMTPKAPTGLPEWFDLSKMETANAPTPKFASMDPLKVGGEPMAMEALKPRVKPKPKSEPAPQPLLPQQEKPEAKQLAPEVRDYISKKFGLDVSSDDIKEAQERAKERQKGLAVPQAIAALGGAISGRGAEQSAAAFDKLRSQIDEEEVGSLEKQRRSQMDDLSFRTQSEKAQRESDQFDPNSKQSIQFRKAIEANFPQIAKAYGDNWQSVTAGDREALFEPLKLKEGIEARKEQARILSQSRADAADERKLQRDIIRDEKEALLNVPGYEREGNVRQRPEEAEKARKAKGEMDSLNRGMAQLKTLIKDKGNFEYGGKEGSQMESLTSDIRMRIKNLYDLGALTGPDVKILQDQIPDTNTMGAFFTRESTAQGKLDQSQKNFNENFDAAMRARGYRASGDKSGSFPMQVRKDGKVATVKSEAELREAREEGWQ